MLVITGTQRSGTSLIAKALEKSRYDLGSSWWDEEVQGGYENEVICAFYREHLGDPTFPFNDMKLPTYPEGVIEELFMALDLEVTKYSYLLMNPAFVMMWLKFRPKGDTFLVMDRNKREVINSKLRIWDRFQHDSLLLNQSPEHLHANFEVSLILLEEFGYNIRVLPFPKCVNDLEHINATLAALDPNVQIKLGAWERTLDTSKIHFGGVK